MTHNYVICTIYRQDDDAKIVNILVFVTLWLDILYCLPGREIVCRTGETVSLHLRLRFVSRDVVPGYYRISFATTASAHVMLGIALQAITKSQAGAINNILHSDRFAILPYEYQHWQYRIPVSSKQTHAPLPGRQY